MPLWGCIQRILCPHRLQLKQERTQIALTSAAASVLEHRVALPSATRNEITCETLSFEMVSKSGLLLMAGPYVLNAFFVHTEAGTKLLPRVVPDQIRIFFGLHWTAYDKLWVEACSLKTQRLSDIGRRRFCE